MKNQLNAVAFAFDNVHSVSVRFDRNSSEYTYLSLEACNVGDKVVVDSPINGLTIATVVKCRNDLPLELLEASYEYKFIVQRVDVQKYQSFQEDLGNLRALIKERQRAKAEAARQEALAKAKENLGLDKDQELADAVEIMRARAEGRKPKLSAEAIKKLAERQAAQNDIVAMLIRI